MKRVAVLGGGPAGAFAAERLAAAGVNTVLFDEKLAWEKPCGGGLSAKAYEKYPFLLRNSAPKRVVATACMAAPGAGVARMSLRRPLVIYSRFDLNRMLLERAERAGARIEKARITGLARTASGWRLSTRTASLEADFCIVATGARNSFKDVGARLTSADVMCALGYYVPAEQEHIDIQFLPPLEGYIWIFPRCGHLSVGICGKGEPAAKLRGRLESYMLQKGIARKDAIFYSHVLPSLAKPAWRDNRVAGPGWMAVGDAGGLVDPITGEGLYYAIRSADLASRVLLSDERAPEQQAETYRALLRRDFASDLEFGAGLARRFYQGRFLFGPVTTRMVQLMRGSARFEELVQDLFAGVQGYVELKKRLRGGFSGTLFEAARAVNTTF